MRAWHGTGVAGTAARSAEFTAVVVTARLDVSVTGAGSGPATVSVGAGTFRVAGTRGFNEGFFTNNDTKPATVQSWLAVSNGGTGG